MSLTQFLYRVQHKAEGPHTLSQLIVQLVSLGGRSERRGFTGTVAMVTHTHWLCREPLAAINSSSGKHQVQDGKCRKFHFQFRMIPDVNARSLKPRTHTQ